jgi:hypothetical protein
MANSKFGISPLNPNSKEKNISSKGEIFPNMTKLGIHIKISGNCNVFNKKKVWGDQENDRRSCKNKKDEFCGPVVWFSMVNFLRSSTARDHWPSAHEWACLNGTGLQIKDLQSIESATVVTFFKVSMLTPKEVILAEFTKILLEAQRRASNDLLDTSIYDFFMDGGIELGQSLLLMNLCVQVAMLKGLRSMSIISSVSMPSRRKEAGIWR